MTREEEIINAAYNEAEVERQLKMHPQVFEQGFVAGAQWADQHPDIDVRTMAAWQSGYNEGIAKSRWISVDDELPKNKEHVFITDGEYTDTGFYEYTFYEWQPCEKWLGDITHWMPLPAPPSGSSEKPNNSKEGGSE